MEEMQEALRYTTWVLKVSIHCEGCRRKIKKILTNMEGVYKVSIDLKQQKAVVIGNVEPEVLIKRIMKAGRHAELWPEMNPRINQNKQSKPKNKERETDEEETSDGEDKEGNSRAAKDEVKHVVTFSSGGQPPPQGGEGMTAGTGGGNKKKKKKKRKKKTNSDGSNNNINRDPGSGMEAPPSMDMPTQVTTHTSFQYPGSPPHHQVPYSSHYYSPPPQMCATNYNMAHPPPSSNAMYGPSYYASPPPGYWHPSIHEESPSSDNEIPASESFEILSDENPNACVVM